MGSYAIQREGGTKRVKSMTLISGKIAIITGASAGIGYETAKLFAHERAKVVVGTRRQSELDALVAEITEAGGECCGRCGGWKRRGFRQSAGRTSGGSIPRAGYCPQ